MMKGIKYACFSVLSLALLSACSMNQSSESSMAVSYTHLDVYKRQVELTLLKR